MQNENPWFAEVFARKPELRMRYIWSATALAMFFGLASAALFIASYAVHLALLIVAIPFAWMAYFLATEAIAMRRTASVPRNPACGTAIGNRLFR
jgi:hypothetical protein